MAPSEDSELPMALRGAIEEAERSTARRKACSIETAVTMEALIQRVNDCSQQCTASPADARIDALRRLVREIDELDAVGRISKATKELHGSVSKLGKAVDKAFSLDATAAMRDVEMDKETIDRIVADHLYREGDFQVADILAKEANIADSAQMKAPYAVMHTILQDLRKRDLSSVRKWTEANIEKLRLLDKETSGHESPRSRIQIPCAFEFSLHRLGFIQELEHHGCVAALAYARKYFPLFLRDKCPYSKGAQRLMGTLVFYRKFGRFPCEENTNGTDSIMQTSVGTDGPSPMAVDDSSQYHVSSVLMDRYGDIFTLKLWDDFEHEFRRQCCALLDQAHHSPLLVTVAAGAAALPTLLKLASVVARTQPAAEIAQQADELPVEVPLGSEFVFHSIFACPVSREQSSLGNPPMMLPCGHCICRASVLRMAKSSTRSFKCPYCPMEASLSRCIELKFPDRLEDAGVTDERAEAEQAVDKGSVSFPG